MEDNHEDRNKFIANSFPEKADEKKFWKKVLDHGDLGNRDSIFNGIWKLSHYESGFLK